jgi:hypothetical protein
VTPPFPQQPFPICSTATWLRLVDFFPPGDALQQVFGVEGLALTLQLLYLKASESMGNHDSKVVDADSVD